MSDDIVVHPCKTIDCIKTHLNAYSSGQCSRHYGPKHNQDPNWRAERISDLHHDYSHDADSDSSPKPEEVWTLLNDSASDSDTSIHDASHERINDHVQETSEVNDFI